MKKEKFSNRAQGISSFHVMDIMSRAKTLEDKGRSVIHMEVGEPDFPTPTPIIEAGKLFLGTGRVHYTKAQGLPELREKIAAYYHVTYGVKITPEQVFITPGASGALMLTLSALIDSGDEFLLSDPGYPCNSNLLSVLGGCSRLISVTAEQNFQLTPQQIKAHWGEKTKGVMVASPSNPTGNVLNQYDLSALIKETERLDGVFISDEIYHGLVYEDRAYSALEFSNDVFVVNSFSKFFGMTGWRLGWLIAPPAYTKVLNRLMQNLFIAAPTHSQYAALSAFEEPTQQILLQRRDQFKSRRDVLYEGLKTLGFKLGNKPEGAFYIYADCSDLTKDSYTFAIDLLNETGVAITPGVDFGCTNADTSLRFAYTTDIDNIKEGLARIGAFIASRKAQP